MKKFLLIAILALVFQVAKAQNQGDIITPNTGPSNGPKIVPRTPDAPNLAVIAEQTTEKVDMLTKKLGLTEEQKGKVFEIVYASLKEAELARLSGDPMLIAKFENKKAIDDANNVKIMAVLKKEQLKKFELLNTEVGAKPQESKPASSAKPKAKK